MDPNDASVLPSVDQPVNLNDAILPSSDHPVDLMLQIASRVLPPSDRIQIEELAELFLLYHIRNQTARSLSMTSMPDKHKSKWRRMKRTQRLMTQAERTILRVLVATARRVQHGEHLDDALQKACKKNRNLQAPLAEILKNPYSR